MPLFQGFHKFGDQGRGGHEAHRQAPLPSSQTQIQGEVGLACAAVADGQAVLTMLDVLAPAIDAIPADRLALSQVKNGSGRGGGA